MGPVGVKQRRCGSAIGEAKGVAGRPLALRYRVFEPAVCGIARLPCFGDTLAVAMLRCADAVGHDLLHRRPAVVVAETVYHPHVERGARLLGAHPPRPRMTEAAVLDDDGG